MPLLVAAIKRAVKCEEKRLRGGEKRKNAALQST